MGPPLVVAADPDVDARTILDLALRSAGYLCQTVADGEHALEAARGSSVRLLLTELYLPAAGECCLLRAVKRSPALHHLPVLVHTAYATEKDRNWAIDQGCDELLVKPTSINQLLRVVARLVGPAEIRRASAERHAHP